ncbi:hypothetical protein EVAR_44328_1 [Eumeta japonica]|uniref:Uncharacterized protein n=1 Tax=Eumeta variegata TaxID=151549 RepID=A0A4C1X7I9_EUMVA|nr:hypothetical protein EVAR_44328_1 [Eumeta japonica]
MQPTADPRICSSSAVQSRITACHVRRLGAQLSVVFNTPYALVDVTVCIFLRMCLAAWHESTMEGDLSVIGRGSVAARARRPFLTDSNLLWELFTLLAPVTCAEGGVR